MGNAPLPRPPAPTDRKIVIPVRTTSGWSTDLELQPPLEVPEDDTVVTASESAQKFSKGRNNAGENLPSQLIRNNGDEEGSITYVIPPEEYSSKVQCLEVRLSKWKGGKIRMGIGLGSLLVVVGFFVAWMMPAFAQSPFVRAHPFYATLIALGLMAIYAVAFRCANQSTRLLLEDVDDLFRTWKRDYGVRVQLIRVSHWTLPSKQKRKVTRTTNCFALVMNIMDPDQDGDDVSLGTIHTEGSNE